MIKLVEIYKDTVREAGSWHLREIFINPDHGRLPCKGRLT